MFHSTKYLLLRTFHVPSFSNYTGFGYYHYPSFIAEKTEAGRGWATCPRYTRQAAQAVLELMTGRLWTSSFQVLSPTPSLIMDVINSLLMDFRLFPIFHIYKQSDNGQRVYVRIFFSKDS